MTNTRLVAIGYVVLGLLFGLFLEHVLVAAFGLSSATQPLTSGLFGSDSGWSWATVIGLAIAAGVSVYLWKNPRSHEFSMEIGSELRKVTWPSMAETRAATVAVIVASLIAAILLGLFDVFWQFLTDKIQNPTL